MSRVWGARGCGGGAWRRRGVKVCGGEGRASRTGRYSEGRAGVKGVKETKGAKKKNEAEFRPRGREGGWKERRKGGSHVTKTKKWKIFRLRDIRNGETGVVRVAKKKNKAEFRLRDREGG